MDHVDPWDLLRERQFREARAAFEARPDFAELVAQADARGYRRIALHEQMDAGKTDAYLWRGGVWVKKEEEPQTTRGAHLERMR